MLTANNDSDMRGESKSGSPGVKLGQWVRERRTLLNLTQEQLADRMDMDVDRNWLTQLEGGRRKGLPDNDLLFGLSMALGLTLTDVLQAAGVVPIDIDRTREGADPEVERLVALVRTVNWTPDRVQIVGDMLRGMIRNG